VRRSLLRMGLIALALAALGLASFAVGLSNAERDGREGVIVSLDGSVSPRFLPRSHPIPVSLTLTGTISSEVSPPPQLGSIEVAFGARGAVSTAGLPNCPSLRLQNTSPRQALAQCAPALVGRGTIVIEDLLDPQRPVLARASALAFNGIAGGRPAVLVQGYSASPPASFVLPFYIRRHRAGAYGVTLQAAVSPYLGRWLRLRSFSVTFGRRYSVHGMSRSYLSASCPLPPRFHIGFFPLARATYHFVPAPTLTTTILRACRVRG
jgi:hypothetical protein